MACEIRSRALLPPAVVQLAQLAETVDVGGLTDGFGRVHCRLLLFHVFFRGEELVTVLCVVLVLRADAVRLVSAQHFGILVLDGYGSLELPLLLAVVVADLRPLHDLGQHPIGRVGLLVGPWSYNLVNFKFQWFFFSFLIFCLFELQRLAIR